ncbi:MAG: hypothetical protein D6800_10995, partial [Candidatus Zixiibacteriota bacterium]
SRVQTVRDTVLFQPPHPEFLKQEVIDTVDHEAHLTQKPTVALFKSMFVPGWGQIGNHKYLKAAVIIGLQSWFIASAVHYGRQASDYRRQWLAETDLARRRELYSQFDERRDKRNKFIWFAGLTTFVSMFDAYVDAHLSGKPREPKVKTLSVRLGPDPGGGGRVELALRF